jgi:hypothetical protein
VAAVATEVYANQQIPIKFPRVIEMQISAEIRWFWLADCPGAIEAWFNSGDMPPGGGRARHDEYLHEPDQIELGMKRRGEKPGVEVKGLVTTLLHPSDVTPFVGPIEIWCKWQSLGLVIGDLAVVRVRKVRLLRKFQTHGRTATEIRLTEDETPRDRRALPELGCNVELTRIELRSGQRWRTLGFEAFGDLQSVEQSLLSTLSEMASRGAPSLGSGELLSYPAWLSKHVPQSDKLGPPKPT